MLGSAPRSWRRGTVERFELVVTPPGAANPAQTISATFDADSMHAKIQTGTAPVQNLSVAMPPGTVVVASSSPWAVYEGEVARFLKAKAYTAGGVLYFMGAGAPERFLLRRLGRDSVGISNTHGDDYHAAVDKAGRILGTLPIAGTAKYAITRVTTVDLDALASDYLAREQAGTGVGVLSPRDTVRVGNAGGAAITIDYGRPAMRGRTVFGAVVPYGEVWRTGANAATQMRTDKALDFGGTVVPAGFYTLWTIPGPTGWKLIINGETGQWGTAHKADKDLFTLDMKATSLPQVVERFTIGIQPAESRGLLTRDWAATRASVAFTVVP